MIQKIDLTLGDISCVVDTVQTNENGIGFKFHAAEGLYQFSVLADASLFDWSELYITFNKYGNVDQRTGPWDFNELNLNKPLVPSYWVRFNGKSLGLWFFQRVSEFDIKHRQFRGRMAFDVEISGEVSLEFIPYRPFKLDWISARLEMDPEDCMESFSKLDSFLSSRVPVEEWSSPNYLKSLHEKYLLIDSVDKKRLDLALQWAMEKSGVENAKVNPNYIEALILAWRLNGNEHSKKRAVELLVRMVDLPHWNNPMEDGYAHDGDMAAGVAFRVLAWAYVAWAGEMDDLLKKRILSKLEFQGQRFFELTLLNRDYWGGSILQDHGWQSMFSFGTGVLTLLKSLPKARRWVSYIIPRIRRALDAMPRDGVIPPSSYAHIYLYVDEMTHYRDTLLEISGEDIFDSEPIQRLVDYLALVVRPTENCMIVSTRSSGGNSQLPLIGGQMFLNRIASKFKKIDARKLFRFIQKGEFSKFYHSTEETAYHMGAIWGFLSWDFVACDEVWKTPVNKMNYFEDSGLVYFRSGEDGMTFLMQCGPWCGHHAYRKATGPCDRLEIVPSAGHFEINIGGRSLLVSPDAGYRLNTLLRSCLLVDGKGQCGDIGYPMSLPSALDSNSIIQKVSWNEAQQRGHVRLDLTHTYPEELGLSQYTREFFLGMKCQMVCRDYVVLFKKQKLTWLFQGKSEDEVRLDRNLKAYFGRDKVLTLTPKASHVRLDAGVYETPVVWGYASSSGFLPFHHVRYDTVEPAKVACFDFIFSW